MHHIFMVLKTEWTKLFLIATYVQHYGFQSTILAKTSMHEGVEKIWNPNF